MMVNRADFIPILPVKLHQKCAALHHGLYDKPTLSIDLTKDTTRGKKTIDMDN